MAYRNTPFGNDLQLPIEPLCRRQARPDFSSIHSVCMKVLYPIFVYWYTVTGITYITSTFLTVLYDICYV